MLICLCEGVSHREVEDAVRRGATDVDQVGDACGAGTGCGACRDAIRDMVNGHSAREATCPRRSRVSSPTL